MDPAKLRSTDIIITQDAQIKNLASKEVYLNIYSGNLEIQAQDVGRVQIGTKNEFTLQTYDPENTIEGQTENKNILLYQPEPTDSIISGNKIQGRKIIINGAEVFDLDSGEMTGMTVTLSKDKEGKFSKRNVQIGDQKIGTLFIHRKDDYILNAAINIDNLEYETQEVFADASTNGLKGIGFNLKNSVFSKQGYKSIENNQDARL